MNTHIQHVLNAVEAEIPNIIKETQQRKKHIINEKINQVTKHVEIPQSQIVEKTIGIPQLEIVEQTVETPETQMIQCARTSERSGTAPVRHAIQTEIGEVVEIETSIPEEELHGVGGFVFGAHGNRVANELGGRNRRDVEE